MSPFKSGDAEQERELEEITQYHVGQKLWDGLPTKEDQLKTSFLPSLLTLIL